MPKPITWSDIETDLDTITPVDGGFSQAHRGLVRLPAGRQVFVKIGTEENSKEWARKEIAVYRYLQAHGFAAIPELLCANPNQTAFCLEALTEQDGWDWSDTWTSERLTATLQAMDNLARLQPQGEPWMSWGQLALDESRDGWAPLAQSPELERALREKLRAAGHTQLAKTIDLAAQATRSATFAFKADTLVHFDVRADNCAWNASKNQVKLVDWNWTQLGDARVDSAAMLTHVQRAGLAVLPAQAARLDAGALQWMAGFWLYAAATPIWPGGSPRLRDFQLEAGVTALDLASKV